MPLGGALGDRGISQWLFSLTPGAHDHSKPRRYACLLPFCSVGTELRLAFEQVFVA
jgi:hypothetical protein